MHSPIKFLFAAHTWKDVPEGNHSGSLSVGGSGSSYLLIFTYLYFLLFYSEYVLLLS